MTSQFKGSDRTIGQLVADATHDVQGLVKSEIALAKAEVQQGAGLLGAAAFVGLIGLIFLFHTLAQVIAIWLPVWAGYLIVTAVLLIVAAVLGLVGKSALQKAKPVPERAISEAQKAIADIKP